MCSKEKDRTPVPRCSNLKHVIYVCFVKQFYIWHPRLDPAKESFSSSRVCPRTTCLPLQHTFHTSRQAYRKSRATWFRRTSPSVAVYPELSSVWTISQFFVHSNLYPTSIKDQLKTLVNRQKRRFYTLRKSPRSRRLWLFEYFSKIGQLSGFAVRLFWKEEV